MTYSGSTSGWYVASRGVEDSKETLPAASAKYSKGPEKTPPINPVAPSATTGTTSNRGRWCASTSGPPRKIPLQKRQVYASVVPAKTTERPANKGPRSSAAVKKNSSAKKPTVKGRETSVAAAAPEATARSSMGLRSPPSLLIRSSPVASVTAPA